MTRSVLVVDDEFGIVEVLSGAFSDRGYRVMQAYNGSQAVARMAEELPDLVISDYMMPAGDGRKLLETLANQFDNIPVILMSGVEEATIRRSGAKYHVFLRKPFRLKEMLESAARLLETRGGAGAASDS